MKIAILTGGGDVPGLNACIKAVVYSATDEGHEVIGIRRGWRGLLWFNSDDPASFGENCISLNKAAVRTIDRTGGQYWDATDACCNLYGAPPVDDAMLLIDFR